MSVNRKEVAVLESKFKNLFDNGTGSSIIVSGEAGVGKSHFVKEYIKKLTRENRNENWLKVLSGTSGCDRRNSFLYPWRELLIDLEFNIAALHDWKILEGNPEIDYKKIVRNVYEKNNTDWLKLIPVVGNYASQLVKTFKDIDKESEVQKEAHRIMLHDLNVNMSKTDDIFIQLMNKFRQLCENHILVLFINDIQFFDSSSLELFYCLSKNLSENPYRLLLIGSFCEEDLISQKIDASTGVIESHPVNIALSNLKNLNAYENITLSRFDIDQIKEFYTLKFPGNAFTKDFFKEVEKITNGNAYFLEEVTRHFQKNNDIYDDKGVYFNKPSLNINIVSSNLQEAVKLRYNELHDDLKTALDIASVMGDDFSAEIISQIMSEEITDFHRTIVKLRKDYEIIEKVEKDYFKLTKIYKFIHYVFQRFVYENLIEDEFHIDYHHKIAGIMKTIFTGEDIKFILEQYSFHLGIGNRIVDDKANVILNKTALQSEDVKNTVNEYIDACKKLITQYEEIFSNKEVIKRSKVIIDLSKILENKELEFEYTLKHAEYLQLAGEWKEADLEFQNALKLAEELKDKSKVAGTKSYIGHLKLEMGEYDESLVYLNESLTLFEELKDKSGVAKNLINIGSIFKFKARNEEAISNYEKALKLREELNEKKGIGVITMNLGNIYYNLSDFTKAEIFYQRSLSLYEELNDRQSIPRANLNIGNIHLVKGNYDAANEFYQKALNGYEETSNKKGTALTFKSIGVLNYNLWNFDLSIENYNKSLKINETLGSKKEIADCIRNIGLVLIEKKDFDNAMEYFLKAKEVYEKLDSKTELALCLSNIGEVLNEKGESLKSLENFERAISICKELEINYTLSNILYKKAIALFKFNNIKESEIVNNEALEKAKICDRKDIIFSSQILSANIISQTDKEESMNMLKRMLNEFKEDHQIAEINSEIYKLNGEEEALKISFDLYTRLNDESKNNRYGKILEGLQSK